MNMKYFKKVSVLFISVSIFLFSGCTDKFADINTDSSAVTEGDVNELFTQAEVEFEPSAYEFWYYNAPMLYKWGEIGIGSTGYTSTYQKPTEYGGQGEQTYDVLNYKNDIVYNVLADMDEEDAAEYDQQVAALDVLCIYLGIFDTDMYGDMPYNEACLAKYTDPAVLAPSYDKVEDLYTQWLGNLDDDMEVLSSEASESWDASQDLIYSADVSKWARLANSLKLKIAVRLLTQKKDTALLIAQDVANSSIGVLDGEDDDFLYNKAYQSSSSDDYAYHFDNDVLTANGLAPTQLVTDFMINNQDPRVRFFFTKNEYNSKVVQAFFDQGVELPDFIAENVNYTTDSEGNKTFESWGGLGEPWVRYYGLPNVMNANKDSEYDGYFKTTPYTLTNSSNSKYTYTSTSTFNQQMVEGYVDIEVPTAPNDNTITETDPRPWYGMYMSTAEVNLYLAEFSLLGATLPQTAEYYYNLGVESSVEEYDRLAGLNGIAYYGTTYDYDDNEEVIDLQDGEIETMMAQDDVALTGTTAQQLEKVRIQEILHFMYAPSDQFNVVRRSGIPSRKSSLFQWVDFDEPSYDEIPRRYGVETPSSTDLMYDNEIAAYEDQGFTIGTSVSTSTLNSERVWQDKGAPNFGEGEVE